MQQHGGVNQACSGSDSGLCYVVAHAVVAAVPEGAPHELVVVRGDDDVPVRGDVGVGAAEEERNKREEAAEDGTIAGVEGRAGGE